MGRAELLVVRHWFSRDGLIEDQRGAYTMQYHAFCLSVLGEILHGPLKDDSILSVWFRDSIEAFSQLVLPGGQCNYLGRGSLQSFGYAAACLAFAHAYRLFKVPHYLEKLGQIFNYLRSFQRGNGSLPLVLREGKEGDPTTMDLSNPEFCGWWSYNNFYDYLPFTGGILARTAHILGTSTPPSDVKGLEPL